MYDRLNNAGYRVLTQVAAGGYRIDLVVEGTAGRRLAVECDGDQYHGPEVWMEDMQRQRTLERAGWTFWRCWGSSFIRDSDSCIADLTSNLNSQGIDPIGALDADLSDVVEYREVGHIDSDDALQDAAEIEAEAAAVEAIHVAVSQETTEPEVENLDDSIEEDIDNKSRRRAEDVADEEIRNAVRDVLSYCSNKSCTLQSLTARVLKELGIVARGNPRANFEKRLRRAVVRLGNRKILEIYKAKNQRVRLNNEPLFKGSS